jgi:hypothetical protein
MVASRQLAFAFDQSPRANLEAFLLAAPVVEDQLVKDVLAAGVVVMIYLDKINDVLHNRPIGHRNDRCGKKYNSGQYGVHVRLPRRNPTNHRI